MGQRQAPTDAGRRPPTEPSKQGLHAVNPLRILLFGRPIATEQQAHTLLPKVLALPIFSSDAISSVAYASQEILLVLGAAGLWTMTHSAVYSQMAIGVTIAIVALLVIVAASYIQTIYAYPSGGGSYIVSKENLGTFPGLIAASALLIDYVLTVAVSLASGVQNLLATPLFHPIANQQVLVCLACIGIIAYLNLRGLKESGPWFAAPTYVFIVMALLMVGLGLAGWTAKDASAAPLPPPGSYHPRDSLALLPLIGIALMAFANGCSAMTGTEAISNCVPSFKKPQSRNAAVTLVMMAAILGTLFIGISSLAMKYHVVYWHHGHETAPAVIAQLSSIVFGETGPRWLLYYVMQFSTMLILVLAANTSFAGFPGLGAILARDRFLPRQLTNQGDKLVFTNGILLLGAAAAVLIVAFKGSVDRLIPLYALGVFTAFTLSQSGMVLHWLRERGPNWAIKSVVNGLGAVCTFVVLCVIAYEKFPEGAWVVVVASAVLIAAFRAVYRHYEFIRSRLSIIGYTPDNKELTNTVILLVPSLHRGMFPALRYAKGISKDCRAIHVNIDPADTPRLVREWEQYVGEDIPLVILPSPYRSLIGPLLAYLDQVRKEREDHVITVVLPEFVPGQWWHGVLHNSNSFLLKYYLGKREGIILTNVRYFLATETEPATTALPGAPI